MDQTKLDDFLATVVADLASTSSAALVRIGDRLGLYRAMAGAGPLTAAELAGRTGTAPRYVQEWLNNQAAGGYVHYDSGSERYELPEEHATVLADEASPALMLGGFDLVATYFADEEKFVDAFRTGSGVGWHEHDPRLYPACERFFRPLYRGSLLQSWIPALDGVHDRLTDGIEVADVGCGYGTSTVEMALAYPRSRFTGFDYHDVSIAAARKAAADAGVAERVRFEIASAAQFPGDYDLVCHFDSLHDMGDPVAAAAHVRQALSDGGTWLLVEPMAGDSTAANMHLIGRIYYAGSALLCTPSALAQGGPLALGNQVGEARWRELLGEAGFGHVRRAASTPFNLILEVRP
ncbi:MAG: class I SAM-dependent methyltransferase [Pseudonocardia sp.]